MTTTKTVNRGVLARQLAKGLYEAKCDYHMTDDYYGDAEAKFGKTDWMPARFVEDHKGPIVADGVITLDRGELRSDCGEAYLQDDGTIALIVDNGLSFTLRRAAPTDPTTQAVSAPKLTMAMVQARVAEVARIAGEDPEGAHWIERGVHADVLRAVADGAQDSAALAAAALKSLDIQFRRI